LFPLGILLYKSQVLNLSLIPQMVDDVWNVHMSVKPKGEKFSFTFPIPKSGPGMRVADEKIKSKGFEVFIDTASDSNLATWSSKEPIKERLSYTARVDLKPLRYKNIPKDFTETYPRSFRKYL